MKNLVKKMTLFLAVTSFFSGNLFASSFQQEVAIDLTEKKSTTVTIDQVEYKITLDLIDEQRCADRCPDLGVVTSYLSIQATDSGNVESIVLDSDKKRVYKNSKLTIELLSVLPQPSIFNPFPQNQIVSLAIKSNKKDCAKIAYQSYCTADYKPTTCSFEGKEFRGTNSCRAAIAAEVFACKMGLDFDRSTLSCKSEFPGFDL